MRKKLNILTFILDSEKFRAFEKLFDKNILLPVLKYSTTLNLWLNILWYYNVYNDKMYEIINIGL